MTADVAALEDSDGEEEMDISGDEFEGTFEEVEERRHKRSYLTSSATPSAGTLSWVG